MIVIRVFLFMSTRREIHILVAYQKYINKHRSKWHRVLFQQIASFTCTGAAKPMQTDPTSDLLLFTFRQPIANLPETFVHHPSTL